MKKTFSTLLAAMTMLSIVPLTAHAKVGVAFTNPAISNISKAVPVLVQFSPNTANYLAIPVENNGAADLVIYGRGSGLDTLKSIRNTTQTNQIIIDAFDSIKNQTMLLWVKIVIKMQNINPVVNEYPLVTSRCNLLPSKTAFRCTNFTAELAKRIDDAGAEPAELLADFQNQSSTFLQLSVSVRAADASIASPELTLKEQGLSLPADTDKDGVPDAFDNCKTNENWAQTDIDQDGTGDVCALKYVIAPNGVINDPVIASPVTDTDGDGVADAKDTCADTPVGTDVDANGCSAAQIAATTDTDNDGIMNDADECPDMGGLETNAGCPEPETDQKTTDSSTLVQASSDVGGGACSMIPKAKVSPFAFLILGAVLIPLTIRRKVS